MTAEQFIEAGKELSPEEKAEAYINKQEFKDLAEDDKIFAAYIAGAEEERELINNYQDTTPGEKKQANRTAERMRSLKNLVSIKKDQFCRLRNESDNARITASKLGLNVEVESRNQERLIIVEAIDALSDIIQEINKR